jgi:hypothetical protein
MDALGAKKEEKLQFYSMDHRKEPKCMCAPG